MRITTARPEEVAELEALQLRASLVWNEHREDLLAHPDAVRIPIEQVAAGDVRVVRGDDGVALGFSAVLPGDGRATELDGLFVEPDEQRGGLGRALVADVVGRAEARGDVRVDVTTGPATPFYERLGFVLGGVTPTRFSLARRMHLHLGLELPVDDADGRAVLDLALRYPYERPLGPVRFDVATGAAPALPATPPDPARGRTAVLAVGSNAAPEQLARKFPPDGSVGGTVPVVPALLRDHDVVYAARLARYGSLPATPIPSPGTTAEVHLTLLEDAQIEALDRSEGVHGDHPAYRVVEVDPGLVGSAVPLAGGGPDRVLAYEAVDGPWTPDGDPVALAAVPARGRRWRSLDERAALQELADAIGVGLVELVRSVVADPSRRAAASSGLPRSTG